jgi:hypothetical protein
MIRRSLFDLFRRGRRRPTQIAMPNAFFGEFEFRVNRLVGWVKDKYDSDIDDLQIEVLRHGVVIAACSSAPQSGQRHVQFSLPVEGLFTGAELVKEEVVLIAHDREGNRGQLRLDGAAQIELIRDNLGAPSVGVFDLDFSRDGNARPYLGGGWSGAESSFTWTENDDSFISFGTPAEPGTYALRMALSR